MKKGLKRTISKLLVFVIAFSFAFCAVPEKPAKASETFTVTVGKQLSPTDKVKILARINEIRKEAYDEGLISSWTPAQWSSDMEEIALQRAAEATLLWGHSRPNGLGCFSVTASSGQSSYNEVIASSSEAISAINQWYSEKQNVLNGSGVTGHYWYLINNKYVGIASYGVTVGEGTGTTPTSQEQITKAGYKKFNIEVSSSNVNDCPITLAKVNSDGSYSYSSDCTVYPDSPIKLTAVTASWGSCDVYGTFTSGNTSVAKVDSNGNVTAVGDGEVTINFAAGGLTASKTIKSSGLKWSVNDGVLTISGSGEIGDNFSGSVLPDKSAIKKIVIKSGITKIGQYAFSYLVNLEEVVIENGLTTVGDSAFSGNSNLKKTTIPASVSSIADNAFNTGYYWIGSGKPVINTKIICPSGSYAESYATSKGIKCETVSSGSSGGSSSGDSSSGAGAGTSTTGSGAVTEIRDNEITTPSLSDVNVNYRTHVQNIGWQDIRSNGTMAGTSGRSLRLEGIEIAVSGNSNLGIQYTTHCQNYGWLPWSANGDMNGTEGEAKRLEAIEIKLTGSDASKYDVYYRVHAQNLGWLGWASNGVPAGTAGYAYRLEGIQIVVLKKGDTAPGIVFQGVDGSNSKYTASYYYAKSGSSPVVSGNPTTNENPQISGSDTPNIAYRTHVQNDGWQAWKYNGTMAGTSGRSLRLEGINIKLLNKTYSGGIKYSTHIQNIGWQDYRADGVMSGTSGRSLRLEAIKIELYGEMANHYDVYYRVHAQNIGWMGWAKNGESSGTAGYAYRLEGIQIVLVPKGGTAPGLVYNGISANTDKCFVNR